MEMCLRLGLGFRPSRKRPHICKPRPNHRRIVDKTGCTLDTRRLGRMNGLREWIVDTWPKVQVPRVKGISPEAIAEKGP